MRTSWLLMLGLIVPSAARAGDVIEADFSTHSYDRWTFRAAGNAAGGKWDVQGGRAPGDLAGGQTGPALLAVQRPVPARRRLRGHRGLHHRPAPSPPGAARREEGLGHLQQHPAGPSERVAGDERLPEPPTLGRRGGLLLEVSRGQARVQPPADEGAQGSARPPKGRRQADVPGGDRPGRPDRAGHDPLRDGPDPSTGAGDHADRDRGGRRRPVRPPRRPRRPDRLRRAAAPPGVGGLGSLWARGPPRRRLRPGDRLVATVEPGPATHRRPPGAVEASP